MNVLGRCKVFKRDYYGSDTVWYPDQRLKAFDLVIGCKVLQSISDSCRAGEKHK